MRGVSWCTVHSRVVRACRRYSRGPEGQACTRHLYTVQSRSRGTAGLHPSSVQGAVTVQRDYRPAPVTSTGCSHGPDEATGWEPSPIQGAVTVQRDCRPAPVTYTGCSHGPEGLQACTRHQYRVQSRSRGLHACTRHQYRVQSRSRGTTGLHPTPIQGAVTVERDYRPAPVTYTECSHGPERLQACTSPIHHGHSIELNSHKLMGKQTEASSRINTMQERQA